MKHVAKNYENLWIYSMGKRFRVTAVFTDEKDVNEYMDCHDDQAVIACFGPFVIIARKYSGEKE